MKIVMILNVDESLVLETVVGNESFSSIINDAHKGAVTQPLFGSNGGSITISKSIIKSSDLKLDIYLPSISLTDNINNDRLAGLIDIVKLALE